MGSKVVIIGFGAVAAEVLTYIEDLNKIEPNSIEVVGFIGDNEQDFDKYKIKYSFSRPFIGTLENWSFDRSVQYIIGFANIEGRRKLINSLKAKNLDFLNLIHPSVQIASTARLGVGNIIYPNTIIGPNTVVGNFNLITSYSFISHDCRVGNNNFFSTAGLSGNVSVGNNNFFGIRSTIVPSINIGSNNVIQAGMIVDKNVSENETVFYRFKEKISVIQNYRE